jgi:quercetin dioxygenase-like cupin family protein
MLAELNMGHPMKNARVGLFACIAGVGVLAASQSPSLLAQVTALGFIAKPLLVAPITGVQDQEIAILQVSLEPGGSSPRHTHPGDCYGSIVEGDVELFVDGHEPRRFAAGQAWHNPRGPAHYYKNVGKTPARLINTLIVDKGKPRTEMLAMP